MLCEEAFNWIIIVWVQWSLAEAYKEMDCFEEQHQHSVEMFLLCWVFGDSSWKFSLRLLFPFSSLFPVIVKKWCFPQTSTLTLWFVLLNHLHATFPGILQHTALDVSIKEHCDNIRVGDIYIFLFFTEWHLFTHMSTYSAYFQFPIRFVSHENRRVETHVMSLPKVTLLP